MGGRQQQQQHCDDEANADQLAISSYLGLVNQLHELSTWRR